MIRGRPSFGLLSLLLLPAAGPPADPAAAFGAREDVSSISLSPAGRKVAFISPGPGASSVVYAVDAVEGAQPRRVLSADGRKERITDCGWVSEERLVCEAVFLMENVVPGELLMASRVFAINADGTKPMLLSRRSRADDAYFAFGGGEILDWLPGTDGAVLMARRYVPEVKIGSIVEDKREGYGVDRVAADNAATKAVESPNKQAGGYLSDGRGKVRIMLVPDRADSGYATGRLTYFYRTKASDGWKQLSIYNAMNETGFRPVAVDPDLDVAYGFKRADGRDSLYSVALDGSTRETLIYSHPQVDVDSTVRIGRAQRVVGVTFATDKREAVFFDKDLAALAKALAKALPATPLIRFVDSSVDESKLILWAGSDTDPGRYYLFDKAAKQLRPMMLDRPQLDGVTLAPMKPVTYTASDGTKVPAYLTLPPGGTGKNLPAIVMPHGGPSARDEWGFDWLAQYYASRGFAVLQPNYRGSAGYGDQWYQKNGFQSWRTAIGDVNDAGRWLTAQGIADPAKLAIVGWSYGGYAALQSGVLDPGLFKAVVAIAPVADLGQLVEDSKMWSSHRVARNFIGSGPHLREGSPAQNADKIKAPVLLFHGDKDRNVDVRHARLMHDKLKGAGGRSELVVFEGLDHQLRDGEVRAQMLRRSDAFLRAALKIP
jgi:dipeptidyl aminopeptidase/acylaminoacyl peptidase